MSAGRGLNGGLIGDFFSLLFYYTLSNSDSSFLVDAKGDVTCNNLVVNNDVIIRQDVDIQNSLTVVGDCHIQSNLEVDEAVTFNDTLTVDNDTILNSNLTVDLDVDVSGNVTASSFIQPTGSGPVNLQDEIETLQTDVASLSASLAALTTSVDALNALPKILANALVIFNSPGYTVTTSECTVTTNPSGMTGTYGINFTGSIPGGVDPAYGFAAPMTSGIIAVVTQNQTIGGTPYDIVVTLQTSTLAIATNASFQFIYV